MLGVSVGTVLNMVSRGHLDAWSTEGGHRRIAMSSVLSHLARRQQKTPTRPVAEAARPLEMLLIDDDEFLHAIYRDQLDSWHLPIRLRCTNNGIEGLIEMGRSLPDVLLIDLDMPVMDGFAVLRTLSDRPGFEAMDIIVITGLDDTRIAGAGGLPPGILVWHKPVPFLQLRGFIEARLLTLQRAVVR